MNSRLLIILFFTLALNNYSFADSKRTFTLNKNYHEAYAIVDHVMKTKFSKISVSSRTYSGNSYTLSGRYPSMFKYNTYGGTFNITITWKSESYSIINCSTSDSSFDTVSPAFKKNIEKMSSDPEVEIMAFNYKNNRIRELQLEKENQIKAAEEKIKSDEAHKKYLLGKGYYEEAMKYIDKDDFERASVYLDYAHENNYSTGSSYLYKGISLYKLERYTEAIKYFNAAEKFDDLIEIVTLHLFRGLSKYYTASSDYLVDLEKAGPEGRIWIDRINEANKN